VGVSFATVNRWETGKAKPTIKAMKLIDEYCKKNDIDFKVGEEAAKNDL
jgi:transcriptional regulator with XRE-family HTH domain